MSINKTHLIHMLIWFIYLLKIESVILVSGMLKVWEDTDGCSKKYRCALDIYLMNVLSSSYGIIMYRAINAPVHGKNAVDGLNATDKRYLKGEMELMGVLASNDTTNIVMLPSASKYVFINFADQCLHIINNKDRLNRLKGITKLQKRQSRFKYQSRIYNVQRKYDVDHRGMKIRLNDILLYH